MDSVAKTIAACLATGAFAVLLGAAPPPQGRQDVPNGEYAGPEVCAPCHRAIYDTQGKTAMANTWHGLDRELAPLTFDEKAAGQKGGALHYEVRRVNGKLEFSVAKAGKATQRYPVEAMVGGKRHGNSFLLRVGEVDGIALERPALIEARYVVSRLGPLILSPGFPKETPSNHEDELGRILSPTFERRCLTCHGEPHTLGAGDHGGVRCESCHGPAAAHVNAVGRGDSSSAARPQHLDAANDMEVCAQCHSGLSTSDHPDPMPEDTIVARQVPGLRKSECFIQSGGRLGCTSCHNPHEDSVSITKTSVNVCLSCHSLSVAQHAAICPVDRKQGCTGCHMPDFDSYTFRLTEHWIRVHPDPSRKPAPPDAALRSQVVPKREFLRLIAVDDAGKMKNVTDRLALGEPFSAVARALSMDASAPGGGYLGDMELAEMDPKLAAAAGRLQHGETSSVVEVGNNFMLLERQPRDFRWEANRLYHEASDLKDQGNLAEAVAKNQQALEVYPYFLRSLVLMANMLGQAGKVGRAIQVLQFAVQSYPTDASSQFDLAVALVKEPEAQIQALRRTIELDPDLVAAYQSLGAALYTSGQAKDAIETFRRGLQIDPLSAVLYYDLGLALKEQGDSDGAKRALELAGRLDPEIAARNLTNR